MRAIGVSNVTRAQLELLLERATVRPTMTPAQLVFRFALDVGMAPLTGTTGEAHMREDLAVTTSGSALSEDAIRAIEGIAC